MAIVMTSLKRSKSGAYTARKGIPKDVRSEYRRLYGPAWESLFVAAPRSTAAAAKAQFNEWLADIEGRIAAIRAAAKGEGAVSLRTSSTRIGRRVVSLVYRSPRGSTRRPNEVVVEAVGIC